MSADILNLPVAVQVALASGYAGYIVAFIGQRDHHKTIDVAFVTLVFSLVATVIWARTEPLGMMPAIVLAFGGSVLAGVLWRKWLSRVFRWLLRYGNVTWTNDDVSVLATLGGNSTFPVSQIAVELDDGRWLESRDTSQFNDAPYGPCLIGRQGDVALYLTHEGEPDGSSKELKTVLDPYYGHRLTYIPANRIRQITIRHMVPANRSSQVAASADHSEKEAVA